MRFGGHWWRSICLGALGAVLGLGTYALLRDSAMNDFNLAMAASLMGALPFALAWWILPAVPLARERYETYALLTMSGPVCVLLTCPALALVGGETGAVIGFGIGWVLGGIDRVRVGRSSMRGRPKPRWARSTASARQVGSARVPGSTTSSSSSTCAPTSSS